jgi:hypothetical protein
MLDHFNLMYFSKLLIPLLLCPKFSLSHSKLQGDRQEVSPMLPKRSAHRDIVRSHVPCCDHGRNHCERLVSSYSIHVDYHVHSQRPRLHVKRQPLHSLPLVAVAFLYTFV